MSNKGIVISVVALVIAVGTFYLLEKMHPHKVEEAKATTGVTVDEVFAGTLKPASATEVAAAPAEPVTEPPASAPAEPVATEPAPVEPAAAEPTTEPEPPPAPEPEPVAEPPPPAPAPKAEPPPPPAEPVAAAPQAPAAKKPAPAKKVPIKPWWTAERADQLSLVYAGSAAYKRAIVLMFNGEFASTDAAAKSLQVLDKGGKPVAGKWELGASNRRMLLFPVKSAAVYKVVVKAGLADQRGRKVPTTMQGPVQVQ